MKTTEQHTEELSGRLNYTGNISYSAARNQYGEIFKYIDENFIDKERVKEMITYALSFVEADTSEFIEYKYPEFRKNKE